MLGSAVLVAGTTPHAVPRLLHSARPSAEACNTRNARNPLPELCGGLRVGDNIISQLANKERKSNPDEDYFIYNIEGGDKKIYGAGIYRCVSYKKGYWIVCAQWYVFCPPEENRLGDWFYKKGVSQWIPCGSIIRSIDPTRVFMRRSGQHYFWGKELDDYIGKYGD